MGQLLKLWQPYLEIIIIIMLIIILGKVLILGEQLSLKRHLQMLQQYSNSHQIIMIMIIIQILVVGVDHHLAVEEGMTILIIISPDLLQVLEHRGLIITIITIQIQRIIFPAMKWLVIKPLSLNPSRWPRRDQLHWDQSRKRIAMGENHPLRPW